MTPERWRRVEELFHAATAKDAAERRSFLATECAGDDELRREVESLLAGDAQAVGFIETPAAALLGVDEEEEPAKLSRGERVGPYTISGLIGKGGMGEVYRARDTRLERDVAVKVLPRLVALDPDRLRRIQVEARAAGMLNHPNLVSIHDTGLHAGSPYLVMELLSGETLREALARGPLPAHRVVEIATQIARALAAAHEKGIVHRDLKPENVFLTKGGLVKVLDFGLAKRVVPQGDGGAQSEARTGTGIIVGTAGYMSPEQVRGAAVDHRSDVFSFGAMLYEMLTGRRAFRADSAVETMHAILRDEPPEPPPDVRMPLALERILRRCLQKNPEDRFQSARDLGFAIEALSSPAGADEAIRVSTPVARRRGVLTAAAVLASAALAALVTARLARSPVPTFRRLAFRRGTVSSARFTPDGQTVVYGAAFSGHPTELFATRPGVPDARAFDLAGDVLAVSARGEMAVRLSKEWTLARVPLEGGAPRELAQGIADADFAPDGETLAVLRLERASSVLELPLGTKVYAASAELSSPRVSPDGAAVAFLEPPEAFSTRSDVCFVDRAGKKTVLARDAGRDAGLGWRGSEVVYASHDGVATRIRAVSRSGRARTLLTLDGYVKLFDVDAHGRILFVRDDDRTQIVFHGPGDAAERELSWQDSSYAADLSDDGSLLLFVEDGASAGPKRATYLRKTDGSPAVRLSDGGGFALSPDRSRALVIRTGPPPQLQVVPTGAGATRRIDIGPLADVRMATWLPDGRRVVISGAEAGHGPRLWLADVETPGAPKPITPEGALMAMSAKPVSPDGSSVAVSLQGKPYLFPVSGGAPTPVAGAVAREEPLRFSGDGRFLYTRVRGFPTRLFRIELATGARAPWKELLPADPAGVKRIQSVVLTPDGTTYAYTFERVLSQLYEADLGR